MCTECVLKCAKPFTSGDSINKITLDKLSKIQTNAKKWKVFNKFGDLWIQLIRRMVNKDVLYTIAVASHCVRRNMNKRLFEMLQQEK